MDTTKHKQIDDHLWHYAQGECAHIADDVMDADQENAYEWDFPTTFFWLLIHGYINLPEEEEEDEL